MEDMAGLRMWRMSMYMRIVARRCQAIGCVEGVSRDRIGNIGIPLPEESPMWKISPC